MVCQKCKKTVSESDGIFCRGYCGAVFHAICVKIDSSMKDMLGIHEKNVFWMCDSCAELFANDQFRTISKEHRCQSAALPAAMEAMKSDIVEIHSAINALSAKVESIPRTPVSTFLSGQNGPTWNRNTPKRLRTSDGTPAKPTVHGTRSLVGSVKTVSLDAELVWVYLSAFETCTTENDIATLASDCLALDPNCKPKVVKLVPKGKDLSALNFVSFKIGVPKHLRTAALACETWPEGIQFREFENRRSSTIVTRITSIAEGEGEGGGQRPLNQSGFLAPAAPE